MARVPESRDAWVELGGRMGPHAPFLTQTLQVFVQEVRATDPDRYFSFNGRDSTEDLCRALLDGLLSLQQLRVELLAQVHASPDDVPAPYQTALTRLLALEANLSTAAAAAVDVHQLVWRQVRSPERAAPRRARLRRSP